MLERRRSRASTLPAGRVVPRILVPMKLGDIGEEMVATAVALAKESGATVEALYVVRVPRERAARRAAAADVAEQRRRVARGGARARARRTASTCDAETVRARSIGHAIVDEADARERRPDRARLVAALAPAVAVLLADRRPRPAPRPCEVLVVAFPEGVFEEAE